MFGERTKDEEGLELGWAEQGKGCENREDIKQFSSCKQILVSTKPYADN